mmetsp:Transcript_44614/g.173043  ORF Transcript_44614/g.173043 Transcript_44614/m.173043 type:complete len:116 (-) Transcript_44614:883-1230(-)
MRNVWFIMVKSNFRFRQSRLKARKKAQNILQRTLLPLFLLKETSGVLSDILRSSFAQCLKGQVLKCVDNDRVLNKKPFWRRQPGQFSVFYMYMMPFLHLEGFEHVLSDVPIKSPT